MKKTAAIMMAAVMAMSLAACGGSGETATTAAAAAAPAETKAEASADGDGKDAEPAAAPASGNILEGKTVGFAQTDSMSSWRTTETDDIKKFVEEAGVDFLVVAPLEDNGLQGALQEAMDNEIPVILVDRAIAGEAGTHYTTAIMSDFVWEGEQCAKALIEALPDGGNIVIINGGYDSSTSTDRQDGFVNALDPAKYPIVGEQDGEWLMDKAQSVMENIIQAQGGENIDAVFCVTDDMVQGAMNAIDAAGLKPGEDILTLGIDGTRAAFEAIESGRQLASCTCTPYFGGIVVETITKIINGEEIPAHITNEDTLYTKDNVEVERGF